MSGLGSSLFLKPWKLTMSHVEWERERGGVAQCLVDDPEGAGGRGSEPTSSFERVPDRLVVDGVLPRTFPFLFRRWELREGRRVPRGTGLWCPSLPSGRVTGLPASLKDGVPVYRPLRYLPRLRERVG